MLLNFLICINNIQYVVFVQQRLFVRENKIEVAFTGGEGVDGKVFQFVLFLLLTKS